MSRSRRIVGCGALVIALWLGAMVVTGIVLEGRTRRGVAERVAEALEADATIARGDLALVRGRLDLDDLVARRDDRVGHLELGVAGLRCELPPLGLALVDRDCRELEVRGSRLAISAAALLRLEHPKRPPLHAGRVVIDDARLEFSPNAFVPGLGRVAIAIAHAEAGDTRFKTPLSWLLAVRELRATIELTDVSGLELTYDHGELSVSGSIFGATPVALPVELPAADPRDDARAEIARLAAFATELAERLVARKAADWLESALPP